MDSSSLRPLRIFSNHVILAFWVLKLFFVIRGTQRTLNQVRTTRTSKNIIREGKIGNPREGIFGNRHM